MWHKSHHWVMQPHTVYERRRELRVRECRQTSIIFDKKYQNIDTLKFDTDKLPVLNSYSLYDIMEDEFHREGNYSTQCGYRVVNIDPEEFKEDAQDAHKKRLSTFVKPLPSNVIPFVPKDNNFEEECKIDEGKKRLEEDAYQKQLKEAELRAASYIHINRHYESNNAGCNVMRNRINNL
jgi:hypothetical protein